MPRSIIWIGGSEGSWPFTGRHFIATGAINPHCQIIQFNRARFATAGRPRAPAGHAPMAGRASPSERDARVVTTRSPARARRGEVRRGRSRVAACDERVTTIDVRVRVQDMPVARYRTRVRRRNAPLGARGLPRPVRGRRHGRSDGRVAVIRRPRRTPGDRLRATGDPVTRIGRP